MRDNEQKIRVFFKKIRFVENGRVPHVYGRRQSRRERRWNANCKPSLPRSLAITQSNGLVYSALKFEPLLYHIRFFAGLIPGDDSHFPIFVRFIKLYSRLDYLYLYYSVYIQALNWYRFFSDFEMLYLTAIRNYQASLRCQYWFHSRETWRYLF